MFFGNGCIYTREPKWISLLSNVYRLLIPLIEKELSIYIYIATRIRLIG
jgi:hypothetical protein